MRPESQTLSRNQYAPVFGGSHNIARRSASATRGFWRKPGWVSRRHGRRGAIGAVEWSSRGSSEWAMPVANWRTPNSGRRTGKARTLRVLCRPNAEHRLDFKGQHVIVSAFVEEVLNRFRAQQIANRVARLAHQRSQRAVDRVWAPARFCGSIQRAGERRNRSIK